MIGPGTRESDEGPGCGCALGCVFLVVVVALLGMLAMAGLAFVMGLGQSVRAMVLAF